MDYAKITRKYYAHWLGTEAEEIFKQGVDFIYSDQRNLVQKGYAQPYDIYIWMAENRIIVSYGDKAASKIQPLKDRINSSMAPEDVVHHVQSIWGIVPHKHIKFSYDSLPALETKSHKMTADDFMLYQAFFKECNPNIRDVDWLEEYYFEMLKFGFCYGEIISNKLVCMNDLPDMPYMENEVREIGINTLPEYRGKGLAKRVCISCIHDMVRLNICPQWSTVYANEASLRLALSVGFEKRADVLTVSL